MKKLIFLVSVLAFVFSARQPMLLAKSEGLQDVEGDRIVVLNIDRSAHLPKPFIKGKEASKYIGSRDELKSRLMKKGYTVENVIRHERSPRYQNLSDAVVFDTKGGKVGYVHRKDGSFTMILDYPNGRKLSVVDDASFDRFANVISDDCTVPYVFFGKDGQEVAIVYIPNSMAVWQYVTREGMVAIEVSERI